MISALELSSAPALRPPLRVPQEQVLCAPLAQALDPERFGGKASALAELVRAGFPVPDGFVLSSAAFLAFLRAARLESELHLLEAALAPSAVLPSEARLAAARARVRSAPIPDGLAPAIEASFAKLGAEHALAVRSSGVCEDGAQSSLAGLLETRLNVRGVEPLFRAVRHCWASLWQLRVIDYLRREGAGREALRMAVLVQELVPAEVSGVVFTVNPTTGLDDEAVVEATFGLGEPLVAGRIEPDRYVFELWTGKRRSRRIGSKRVRAMPAEDGGLRDEELPRDELGRATLDDAQLESLAGLAAQLQEHAGRPLDIEFAIGGGKIHVLQARPITRIQFAPVLGEWTTANFREGGVASAQCSALMASLYERAFEKSMPAYLSGIRVIRRGHPARWLRTFYGRPYWNFGEAKRAICSLPGFVERNFDLDLGLPLTYEGDGRVTPFTLGGAARGLPVLFALQRSYEQVLCDVRRFIAEFDSIKEELDLDEGALSALSPEEFAKGYRHLIDEVHGRAEPLYFTTVYNLSNAKLDFSVSLQRASRAAGEELSYAKLVCGLCDVSHLRLARELRDIGRFVRAGRRRVEDVLVRSFAHRWRHKGPSELDLRVPRFGDDLDGARAVLEAAVADERAPDPDAIAWRQHQDYEAERRKALDALPWYARRTFSQRLERVRAYAWWREEMRDRSTFVYWLIRRWTLEAARRLERGGHLERLEHVWSLPVDALMRALEGATEPGATRAAAALGHRVGRSFRNFDAPNELGARYPYGGAARAAVPLQSGRAALLLSGTGCSCGIVEGRVRVARTASEANALAPGEILVAPFTDPGWTPHFARARAIVTETGGLLSHAAVLSREYGIPAVLAVPRATAALRTGALVRVDGDRGVVEVLSP